MEMPKVSVEKFSRNDFSSVKISVYKPEGGIWSLWNWLTKKDKTNLTHTAFDKNSFKLKLNAEDIHKLKANGIDIKKFYNQSKINKKTQLQNNQMFVLPKKKCLKESGIPNSYVVPDSVKMRKPVFNSKAGNKLMISTSTTSMDSKDIFISNNSRVLGVKSQKSLINVCYKVGKESNLRHQSPSESIPGNNLQKRQFNPISVGMKLPYKFSELQDIRFHQLSDQLGAIQNTNTIPMLLSKMKSMEQQLSDIETKTTKINEAVSKQNVLKRSSAKCGLNCKCSLVHSMTKNFVSHKVYSKKSHSSKTLKRSQKQKPKKKSKYVMSSSSERSKTGSFKNKGYPFENFNNSLNISSKKQTKSIFMEHSKDNSDSIMAAMNGIPLGDTNSTMKNDVFFKLLCTLSDINDFKPNQQQDVKLEGKQETQNNQDGLLLGCSFMSKPTFNWKHKSLFSLNDTKAGYFDKTFEQNSKQIKNVLVVNDVANVQPILNDKSVVPEQKSFLSEIEPHQDLTGDTCSKQLIKDKVSEKNQIDQVQAVNEFDPGLDQEKISQVGLLARLHNEKILMSCSIGELDKGNENVLSHDYENSLNTMQTNDTGAFVENPSLKSGDGIDKLNFETNNKETVMFSKESASLTSEEYLNDHHRTPSCGDGLNTVYTNMNCESKRSTNQHASKPKEVAVPLSEIIKEPKIKITILVEDNLKESVSVKSNFTTNVRKSKDCEDFCDIHCGTLKVEDKTDEKSQHYTRCGGFYSVNEVLNESKLIKSSLELKNKRMNEIEGNSANVRKVQSNHINAVRSIEDDILQFQNKGRYMYQKERKQYDKLLIKKQNTNNYIDAFAKIKPNTNEKYTSSQNDKYTTTQESKSKSIMPYCGFNYETMKNERAISNLKTQSSGSTTSEFNVDERKSTGDEIEKLDLTKTQKDVDDNQMEAKRQFFIVIHNEDPEISSIGKCVTVDSTKRSPRCGLTLSQEPISVESEDGISTKAMKFGHQSDKGDNIEIKATDFDCSNTKETEAHTYDNDSLSPVWLSRSGHIPVECVETYSVLVQTDWSLIGKSENEIPKQTVSIQTEQTTLIEKEESIEKPHACKCYMNDSQFSESDSINVTSGTEETQIIDSECVTKKQRSLAITMKKENITQVKLSDLLISVVRDSEKSDAEITSSSNTDPKNIVTVTCNTIDKTVKSANAPISSSEVIDLQQLPSEEKEIFFQRRKIETTIENSHHCTATCFYSCSQKSDFPYTSESESATSTGLHDSNLATSKAPESCDNGSDYTINTALETRGSSKHSLIDNFFEDPRENEESNDKEIGMKVSMESSTTVNIDDTFVQHYDDINNEFLKEDFSKELKIIRAATQEISVEKGITTVPNTEEIKSSNLHIANYCCFDCGSADFKDENSIAFHSCQTSENMEDTTQLQLTDPNC